MESRLAVLSKGPTDHVRQNEPPFVRGGGETPRIMQLSLKDRRVELEMFVVIHLENHVMVDREVCVCERSNSPGAMHLVFLRG